MVVISILTSLFNIINLSILRYITESIMIQEMRYFLRVCSRHTIRMAVLTPIQRLTRRNIWSSVTNPSIYPNKTQKKPISQFF